MRRMLGHDSEIELNGSQNTFQKRLFLTFVLAVTAIAVFFVASWVAQTVSGQETLAPVSQKVLSVTEAPPAPLPTGQFRPREFEEAQPQGVNSVRPDDEWQGMPIDNADPASCVPEIGCGLALACVDGKCVGCETDEDCMQDELCVLQHCIRDSLAECFSKSDCPKNSLCILSGVSSGPRGNRETRAYCQSNASGFDQIRTPEIEDLQANVEPSPFARPPSKETLLTDLKTELRSQE